MNLQHIHFPKPFSLRKEQVGNTEIYLLIDNSQLVSVFLYIL